MVNRSIHFVLCHDKCNSLVPILFGGTDISQEGQGFNLFLMAKSTSIVEAISYYLGY